MGEEEVREVSLEIDSQENIRFTYNLISFPLRLSLRLTSLEYPFDRSDRGPLGGRHMRVYLFGSYKDNRGEYITQPLDAPKNNPKLRLSSLKDTPTPSPAGSAYTGLTSGSYLLLPGLR